MNGKMIYYRGLEVYGEILGRGEDAYIEQMQVRSPDGDDITDMLTDEAFKECEAVLLEDL